MAITNYTELSTAIAAWLDVGTADLTSVIADIVTVGEKRIMREVRVPLMETSMSTAISSGIIAVPSNLIEVKYAYVNTNPVQQLMMVPVHYVYERYPTRSAEGIPVVMARDASNFIFGPYPDSDYTINGTYYKRLANVESSANGLFTANPDLYLFGCLAETEPLLGRDQRIPLWEAKYRAVKDMVQTEADRSRFGGPLMIRPA